MGRASDDFPSKASAPCYSIQDGSRWSSPMGPRYKPPCCTADSTSTFHCQSLCSFLSQLHLSCLRHCPTILNTSFPDRLPSYSRFACSSPLLAQCPSHISDSQSHIFQLQPRSFCRHFNLLDIVTLASQGIRLALVFVMRTSSYAKKRLGKDVE